MPDSKPSQVAFSGAQASQVPPPLPPAFNLVAGTTFGGRFKISRLIAHGGMGSVYLAHDANTGEEVALKLIRPELVATPDALERFLTEGKVARRLSHANIARVFDIDRKDGVWFIAMEFAKGVSLRQWMQSKRQASEPVSLDTALWVARRLLHALHHLHGLKVIHRDVKPENIIVDDPEGTAKTLKLVDFGLARKLNPDATRLTMSGAVVGTLGYMAPEQRSGGTVDARSDLYSVAVIVYELLTGVAFDGLWEPVSDLRQDVRGGIDDWLRAALSKFPEKRPASAKAMLEALDYALAVQSQAPHASATPLTQTQPAPRSGTQPRADRRRVTAFACAGLGILIAIASLLVAWRASSEASDLARRLDAMSEGPGSGQRIIAKSVTITGEDGTPFVFIGTPDSKWPGVYAPDKKWPGIYFIGRDGNMEAAASITSHPDTLTPALNLNLKGGSLVCNSNKSGTDLSTLITSGNIILTGKADESTMLYPGGVGVLKGKTYDFLPRE